MTLAQSTTKMSLKVLYTVENETNTYLTRSKASLDVRVGKVPSPNNESTQLSIGMIELYHVLDEIYLSSPELFTVNLNNCMDYNVYCRDVCEIDEPFVSYGLLSKLRPESRVNEISEHPQEEDEWPLVMGRVCSNFSALLRSKSSTGAPQDYTNAPQACPQTLEVKLRLSRVVTANSSRRSSMSNSSKNPPTLSKPSVIPTKKPFKAQSVKSQVQTKRQTNPRPAPKAVRTQSLPIWNQNKNPQFVLPANSIAHKIYLADRMTKESELAKEMNPDRKPVIFQINSLQHDNTVQKTKVDDSVSKRFDFINKKKMKPIKPSSKKAIPKPKSAYIKKSRTNSVTSSDTSMLLPSALGNQFMTSKTAGTTPKEFKIITEESVMEEILGTQQLKNDDFFEFHEEKIEDADNKENIPPRAAPVPSRFEDLLDMELPDLKTPSDGEKFCPNSKSDDPLEWFSNLFGSPLVAHKEDPQTCNTLPIEEDEQDVNRTITSDIDRTSPIDTLSMPLLELNQQKQTACSRALPSCKDQLRRLPLLSKGSKTEQIDEDNDEDATSSVKQYSTSPKFNNAQFENVKRPAPVPSSPMEDEEFLDELTKQRLKKRKTMPSSPTSMFPYGRTGEEGEDELNRDHTSGNEEFSFRNDCGLEDVDSTPATQYRSSDMDHVKLADDNSVTSKR